MIRNIFRQFPNYFWKLFSQNFRNNSRNFPIFFSKLYKICFENFLKNFKKIHFWIFIHIHLKLKFKNLWVTVSYKCNRSNTDDIECRLVMSLLELSLKVCPHLYVNMNKACRTKANPNDGQKVVFREVLTPNRERWAVYRMFAAQTNTVHCTLAIHLHQHFSHFPMSYSAFVYRCGCGFTNEPTLVS